MQLNMKLKHLFAVPALLLGLLFSVPADAQSSCCSKDKQEQNSACCSSASNTQTSGCSPSNCRGAKTKFGEAKVITNLRAELIAVKAEMEKSKRPVFSERSYDIHGIVGESDEESIAIIAREIQVMEAEFAKSKAGFEAFELPEQKAKQIQYLRARIATVRALLPSGDS